MTTVAGYVILYIHLFMAIQTISVVRTHQGRFVKIRPVRFIAVAG